MGLNNTGNPNRRQNLLDRADKKERALASAETSDVLEPFMDKRDLFAPRPQRPTPEDRTNPRGNKRPAGR